MSHTTRSPEALAALSRHAGPMRHRLQARGGSRNKRQDILADMFAQDGFELDDGSLVESCPAGCDHDNVLCVEFIAAELERNEREEWEEWSNYCWPYDMD